MGLTLTALVAGLGLFFVGLKLLGEHLKALNSKKLRTKISNWTQNPFQGLVW